jgi:beta-lactam-binding protein with PASTA domain
MALDTINAISALAILGPRRIDNRQKVLGTVGATLLPGIAGLAVPLIIAMRATGQSGGPSTGGGSVTGGASATGMVAVPDLGGSDQALAITSLNQLQLKPQVNTATSTDAQKKKVVSQDPPPGRLVRAGTTVTIVAGSGVPQPTQSVVPDLIGERVDDAEAALSSVQLELGDVTIAVSTDDEKGMVVSQDPEAGQVVAIGSEVSAVVGNGPAEKCE